MNKPELIIYLILFVSTAVVISRHALSKGRARLQKEKRKHWSMNRFNNKKRNKRWQ
mgnify:CR=1 FL=1